MWLQTSQNVNITGLSKGHISVLLDARVTWSGTLVVLYVLCMLIWPWPYPRSRSRAMTVSPLPGWFSSFTCSGIDLLWISGTRFLWARCPCYHRTNQSMEGNSKHLLQLVAWSHPFFVHHWMPLTRSIIPSFLFPPTFFHLFLFPLPLSYLFFLSYPYVWKRAVRSRWSQAKNAFDAFWG